MTPAAPDPKRVRAFVLECVPDAPSAAVERLVRFLCIYAALPVEKQFFLAHRIILRESLETVARNFRATFGRDLTSAGVSASITSTLAHLEASDALPDMQD